jgi:zinc transport system substrate-binding protein
MMLRLVCPLFLGLYLGIVTGVHGQPRVVVSIKPVHSLAASVMEGIAEPRLLMEGSSTPHDFSLQPSQAALIEQAELIFWIGESLETALAGSLLSIGADAQIVELVGADGVRRLPLREGGSFDPHVHVDAEAAHADGDHDDHGSAGLTHGEFDAHIWLDPDNAAAIADAIAQALSMRDPRNAAVYQKNAAALRERLHILAERVLAIVRPVRDEPFIVFHDAYQSFERRFGLSAAGSIALHPEVQPGARHLTALRARIIELGDICVFSEPQFNASIIGAATEGTKARVATLDPLGASIEAGPHLYFELIEAMARSFRDCLGREPTPGR